MRTNLDQTTGDRSRRKRRLRATLLAAAVLALAAAGSAAAFQALPPGGQVNDDPGAGINPNLSVSNDDPTNADVVGGALTAGGKAVPWAVFRQTEASGAADQIFSRSFAKGAWTTRGIGTVGGRSSAAPTFSGSLNFDQLQDGEAPEIDFAGAGRTVPWVTWYEHTTGTGFSNNNVFASRFDNTGDANQNKWIFAGQSRGNGGSGPNVPSLNIHTDQDAENPSVAGGSAVDPTKPGPWVTWQETAQQQRPRPDLRQPADRAGFDELRHGNPEGGRRRHRTRAGDRRVLLAADRHPEVRHGRHRSESEHRPDPQRRRARHRLHGPRRTPFPGWSGTRRTARTTASAD